MKSRLRLSLGLVVALLLACAATGTASTDTAATGTVHEATAPASAEATPAPRWHQDLATARQLARQQNRLLVVDLYADWCGWCKALERLVFETPEFQRRAAEDFVLLRVDTEDGGEGGLLKRTFGAQTLPTVLLLDAELAEAGRVTGFEPLEQFLAGLDSAAASHRELLAKVAEHRDSDQSAVLVTLAQELLRRRDSARAVPLLERLMVLEAASPERVERLRTLRDEALRWAETFSNSVAPSAAPGGSDADR
jgi:thioredoxin-related protein